MLKNLPIKYYLEELMNLKTSRNEKASLKDYILNFASEHFFKFAIDEFKMKSGGEDKSSYKVGQNIVIYKNTAPDRDPTILETRIESDYSLNLEKFYHKPFSKLGDFYITSHRCDIGVALILYILDSDIPMNVEAVFTCEENGLMQGAQMFNDKLLKSKRMICLSGGVADTIFTESAEVDFYVLDLPKKRKYIPQNFKSSIKTFSLDIPSQDFPHLYDFTLSLLCKVDDIKLFDLNLEGSLIHSTFTTTMDTKKLHALINTFYRRGKRINKHFKMTCSRLLNYDFILEKSDEILSLLSEIGSMSKEGEARYEIDKYYSDLGLLSINGYIESADIKAEQKKIFTFGLSHHVKVFLDRVYPSFKTLDSSKLEENLIWSHSPNLPLKTMAYDKACEGGFFKKRNKDLDVVLLCTEVVSSIRNGEMIHMSSLINTSLWLKNFFINLKA